MDLHDFVKLIRNRWLTVLIAAAATVIGTIAFTLLQTPLYEASTRLFVSTAVAGSPSSSELYSGNRLSQDRVLSYTQLIMGETLAQRTIDRLDLEMRASELKENVTAKAKAGTVLIDVAVQDASPVRARDIANAISDEFVLMVRDLETSQPGAVPDARVVVEQRATLPEEPVVPRRLRNLAIGIALGVLAGIGLALLRDLLDNTVKSRETLEQIIDAGVVGTVPYDKSRRLEAAISFDHDNSAAAEAFRKLRTNLQFVSVDNPPRVITVASSVPNEGKSTVSVNIALALAEAGHDVLLIDGDMRRPTQHKFLNLVGTAGFSTALSGMAPLDDLLQASKFPRLTVLTAGPVPPNPSELVGSSSARNLLKELRERFDYVIIDTPPLLAVTDASILATQSDGTLLIVRARGTKREHVIHAVGMLADVGANILGSVLTMVPTNRTGAYSYEYSYYAYNYSDKKTNVENLNSRGKKPPPEAA